MVYCAYLEPRYGACFDETLEPQRLLDNIAAVSGHVVVPGKTLLFLDEVQIGPRAIMGKRISASEADIEGDQQSLDADHSEPFREKRAAAYSASTQRLHFRAISDTFSP